MGFTFDEQPPVDTEENLREYLSRLVTQLAISGSSQNSIGGGSNNDPHQFMRWAGNHVSGAHYRVGDVVSQDKYAMICVNDTFDEASPQDNGASSWGLGTNPAWTQQEVTAIVGGGHTWTFTEPGWVKSIRIWVEDISEGTEYRIVARNLADPDFPLVGVIEEQNLDIGEWSVLTQFNAINQLIGVGEEYKAVLFAANTAAETIFIHPWNAGGVGGGDPISGDWNRTGGSNIVRIHNLDDGGIDRSAAMLGSIIGTSINIVNASNPSEFDSYVVLENPTDEGDHVEWNNIALLQRNGSVALSSALCNIEFRIPVAVPTKYVEVLNNWPTGNPPWADINGSLSIAGVDQPSKEDSAFGIDILFQPAILSPDWEIVSFP